ncbi:MAG: toxin-antitoxin system HicB family antitoxin [candidate division Zixibacteria bacterium]|nr:toxin-antitoxin system HicB family antitoxin [candidate division Zixibacteria bacterium]
MLSSICINKHHRRTIEAVFAQPISGNIKNKEPEKPFSGHIMLRTHPELHRKIALEATRSNVSFNAYVQKIWSKPS